jgi:hypothetical protein
MLIASCHVEDHRGRQADVTEEPDKRSVVELLSYAASEIVPAPGFEPWDYGWCVPDYRRSAEAALSSPDGPVALRGDGLAAWEEAGSLLLTEKQVQERWDSEEFWEVLASLVVAASQSNDPATFVRRAVGRMRRVGPALTLFLVAKHDLGTSGNDAR